MHGRLSEDLARVKKELEEEVHIFDVVSKNDVPKYYNRHFRPVTFTSLFLKGDWKGMKSEQRQNYIYRWEIKERNYSMKREVTVLLMRYEKW